MQRTRFAELAGVVAVLALVVSWPFSSFAATDYYVTPQGAGGADGSDWDNAFSNIQDAVDQATSVGDKIYLKEGVYTNDLQISIASKPGLTVLGGYAGSGSPGARSGPETSALTRNTAFQMRIINGSSSTFALDGLTVRNGYVNTSYGGGMYLSGCTVTITNCVLRDNQLPWASTQNGGGGGIYSASTTLKIYDSELINNLARHNRNGYGGSIRTSGGTLVLEDCLVNGGWLQVGISGGQGSSYDYGGAIYSSGTALSIDSCTFTNCRTYNYAHYTADARGGAIYVNGGSAKIYNTDFNGCYVDSRSDWQTSQAYGGAIFSVNANPLTLTNCTFARCYARYQDPPGIQQGGVLYVAGGSYKTTLQACEILGNGSSYAGDSRFASGTFFVTNTLVAKNRGSGIVAAGGVLRAVNTTLADNTGWGIDHAGATVVEVKNVIASGNSSGGIESNAAVSVSYTCGQGLHPGTGNLSGDPLFVDAAGSDYHLESRAGSWHNDPGAFVLDTTNSPCIDAGNDLPYGRELLPNGGIINLGAYGNTAQASKTPLRVTNADGAQEVRETTAALMGLLVSTGSAPTTVYCFWGTNDEERVKGLWGAWTNMGTFGINDILSNTVVNLLPSRTYYYRFYASNAADTAWAEPSAEFTTLGVPVVDNDGGAIAGARSAMLRGTLTSGGQAHVFVYWGTAPGPPWSRTNYLGYLGHGLFEELVEDLATNETYYYRCFASNAVNLAWAASVTSFTTRVTDGYYVTPAGAEQEVGLSWDHAFAGVQAGVDAATNAGDVLYVRHGTYTLTTECLIEDRPGLSIQGRYVGVGIPGHGRMRLRR